MEDYDDVYNLERKIRVTDAKGNRKTFESVNEIRISSYGTLQGDPNS